MRNTTSRRPLALSSLLVPCLLATCSVSASARQLDASEQDAEVALAEQKAAQAFQAFQEKRFAEAVALYIEAYQAAPNADMLYNIARIYDAKLGDRPLAINFYRRYIADPGAVADRVQVANQRLAELREAELAAARPVTPPPSAAPASAGAASAAPESDWSAPEVLGVVLGISGVVGLGVGTGFGIAAMKETRTVHDLCNGTLCSEQRGIDAAESATEHATISTVGFAAGGALLALGAAFYFWPGDEPSEKPKQASDAGLHLNAGIGPQPGGLALELGGSW